MKQLLLLAMLAVIPYCCGAQTYVSIGPNISNEPGNFAAKAQCAIEGGRQWDVFSLGLAAGKTNFGKMAGRDTTVYLEARPNLNVFQQGKFTNTLTTGIGYIFNAQETVMFELASGIEYSWTPSVHINILFGQYYTSGVVATSSSIFFGVSIMKFFSPTKTKALVMPRQ